MSKELQIVNQQALVEDVAHRVRDFLSPVCSKIEIVGSLRRQKQNPNDVDIILIPKDKGTIASTMALLGIRESGGEKREAWIVDEVKVEVYYATEEAWGAFLLMYTGSKRLNISMRILAKTKGLMLNQYGLFRGIELIASKTEEDIFKALNIEYIEPELRE